jgi:tetratricopeptide (TPR) repeat protein
MPRRPAIYPPVPLTSEDIANRQILKEIDLELLGERIRRARQEQKVTQRALCRNLFTSAYLSSMELGKTRPTLTTLQQISERINKSVSYFLRPATPGIGGLSLGWQQEQGRLLQLRQGLLQVSVALSKRDTAEATNLLDQLRPYLSRLPELDQATFHLWQAAIYNQQEDSNSAAPELDEASRLLEAAGSAATPELAARLDLELGLASFNRHQYIYALQSFRNGLNRTGLTDLTLKRRLQLFVARCYLVLEQPDDAVKSLQLFTGQEQDAQLAAIAESNYTQAQSLDLQQGAFVLGRSEQIWVQVTETAQQSDYYLDYTRLLFQTRQFAAAVKVAETTYQLVRQGDPCNRLEVLSLLALLNIRLKDAGKAQSWLEQARLSLEATPCDEATVLARYFQASGEIASASGQAEPATNFYQQALARLDSTGEAEAEDASPTRELRGEIYFELGQLLRQLGRFEEALDFIEKAYRLQ